MKILDTPLAGLKIIEPDVYTDSRGYFFESYSLQKIDEYGINAVFVQDNESESSHGVVRGLHYQLAPFAQSKLVRVVQGTVFDVAVDIRKGSTTFGKWFGVELSGDNKRQMFVPKGFAHGFSVLSDRVIFVYKCDQYYNKNAERGIRMNDVFLNINWKIAENERIVSEKDMQLPLFSEAEMNFNLIE